MLRKAGANWVEGPDRFFDRENEIEALAERVRDGTHTLLTAQRRMGKTRSLRRRTFAAQYGSPAHALSFVSGRLRRSAERGRFSAVGEQEGEFGP